MDHTIHTLLVWQRDAANRRFSSMPLGKLIPNFVHSYSNVTAILIVPYVLHWMAGRCASVTDGETKDTIGGVCVLPKGTTMQSTEVG